VEQVRKHSSYVFCIADEGLLRIMGEENGTSKLDAARRRGREMSRRGMRLLNRT
jgi:hypothetical protein